MMSVSSSFRQLAKITMCGHLEEPPATGYEIQLVVVVAFKITTKTK